MTPAFVAFQFAGLAGLPIVHGLSGRVLSAPQEGNTGYIRDADPEAVRGNRQAFLSELGVATGDLTLARQTHTATVAMVTEAERGRGGPPDFDGFPNTDGLITNVPGIALAVTVADCVPLVLFDPTRHVLGVVHAGWRGTVSGIATAAVEALRAAYGTQPSDVWAGIGPSIGPCCYEVGAEVIDAWLAGGIVDSQRAVAAGRGARQHFDLWNANHLQLLAAGVPSDHIAVARRCVRCETHRFFSHRAAMIGAAQRGLMLMVAQLQPRA